ncbi:hypothetical protein RvY_10052-3 [Ramazzottius varieornatus]|uniref:Uncharacterized protein n=1 Tax=Ramazzottius varieornatus TaxID=947166 RepID=A0A1D1VBH3_RAMVA|nr:hypothetical protein RvY_10052-3 [Ramazzottius varieornatus]
MKRESMITTDGRILPKHPQGRLHDARGGCEVRPRRIFRLVARQLRHPRSQLVRSHQRLWDSSRLDLRKIRNDHEELPQQPRGCVEVRARWRSRLICSAGKLRWIVRQ